MNHRAGLVWAWIGMIFLALATPAFAGGWAVVKLDAWPESPAVGKPLSLGFMVLQHGRTPIDNNPFAGEPLKPLLIATNQETGDKLEAAARKEGQLGHFVVDVTFPKAGTWLLEIVPAPFAGTQFEPLMVQAATMNPASESQPNVGSRTDMTTPIAPVAAAPQSWLALGWPLIALILAVGIGLTLVIRRATLRHQRTAARPE